MAKERCKNIIFIILAINFLLLSLFYPLPKMVDDSIIVSDDYPAHFTRFATFGDVPVFYFAYSTLLNDLKFAYTGLSFIPKEVAFKLYILFMLGISPLFFYLSSKWISGSAKAGLVGAGFWVLFMNFSNMIKSFLWIGVVPFIISSILMVVAMGSLMRYIRNRGFTSLAVTFVFFSWSCLVHPFPFVYSLLFLIPFSIIFLKGKTGLIFSIFLVIFLTCFFLYFSRGGIGSAFHQGNGFQGIWSDFLEYPCYLVVMLLSLFSFFRAYKGKERGIWLSIFFITFIYAYFFGKFELMSIFQTERIIYFAAMLFIAVIPKALLIMRGFEWGIVGTATLVLLLLNPQPLVKATEYTLEFGVYSEVVAIKNYFQENSHMGVFFECSCCRSGHKYGGHSDTLFAYWMGFDYPYTSTYASGKVPWWNFCDGELGGKPILNYSIGDIVSLASKNKITHFVIWSNESKKLLLENLGGVCFNKLCIVPLNSSAN